MKASSLRSVCLSWLFLLLALPSKTAWGFQATTKTQRQRKSMYGSTRAITIRQSRYQYPYPLRPLLYTSSSDNDRNQETNDVERKSQQHSKCPVTNSVVDETPFNLFTQIFQLLSYQSKVNKVEKKVVESESELESSANSRIKKHHAPRNAIVMPKQINASEKTNRSSIMKNPKATITKATMAKNENTTSRQASSSSLPTIPGNDTTDESTFVYPAHDFQKKLLAASLKQRQKDTNGNATFSKKYQESMKHIRVLEELCSSTKVDAKASEPTKGKKQGQPEREPARKPVRKAAGIGITVSKEDVAQRKKQAVNSVNLSAKRSEKMGKNKDIKPKEQQSQNKTLFKSTPPLPSWQTPEGISRMRRPTQFHQRLLRARLRAAAELRVLAAQRNEAKIEEQRLRSQRKLYDFHRRLLEQKNNYTAKQKQRQRILEKRLTQEKRDHEFKSKQVVLFHQKLLAAQYQYKERAQNFKMKRLLQEILQQKETKRKQKEYQFQKRLLAASFQSMEKQKEKEQRDKLNAMLQDLSLMNYTKKKVGEKSKFKFQRNLLKASIENARIARRLEKKKQVEKQKSELQKGLLEQRLRSKARADELKRGAIARAEFQQSLVALFDQMATLTKFEQDFAADELIRRKQKSDFQQELLSARIRCDLVARRRRAENRINELHQSLLEVQRESELAAAQVLEAEERKREAQVELEERQTREEEENENEAKRIEAEQRVKQHIEESIEREAAIRAVLENAGRQQSTTDSFQSAVGMNEYEAVLEMQRKNAIQRRIEEGKRRQDELQRRMENAGRTEASEQIMNRYEEILRQQMDEEMRKLQAEAQRQQEALRRQLEEAGRPKAQEESAASMDKYSRWVEQANKTALACPEPWQPSSSSGAPDIAVALQSGAIRMDSRPGGAALQPEQISINDSAAISPSQDNSRTQQNQLLPQNQQEVDPLVGQVLLDKFVVAEKLRVGGDRSELYRCYHVLDKPQEYALVIKLSHNIQQIELEHRIYGDLFSRLSQARQELFVRAYDWVPASAQTNGRVGFAMECGLENLRGHIWRHGPYTGEKLRMAMENVIRVVQALHGLGVVWSELKAENFIVFNGDKIKAVDLESVAAHNEFLRAYTAETYPPEFPADSLYQCLPQIPVDYSFDIWGMGLTLYELSVGEPLFTLQRTYDVEYIKERLKNPVGIVDEANKKMWKVESGARNIIRRCLVVDPTKRSTCDELLQDPYFASAPPAAFSPSAMGTSSFN